MANYGDSCGEDKDTPLDHALVLADRDYRGISRAMGYCNWRGGGVRHVGATLARSSSWFPFADARYDSGSGELGGSSSGDLVGGINLVAWCYGCLDCVFLLVTS